MKLLVDGHNLIGKMPDIDLADEDDEARLVSRLRQFAMRTHHKITVIFDGGLPGGPSPELSGSGVTVIFAPAGQQADPLIIRRIRQIHDRSAWKVISSDQAILSAAGRYRQRVQRSEELAAELAEITLPGDESQDPRSSTLSEDEVEAWLSEFSNRRTPSV